MLHENISTEVERFDLHVVMNVLPMILVWRLGVSPKNQHHPCRLTVMTINPTRMEGLDTYSSEVSSALSCSCFSVHVLSRLCHGEPSAHHSTAQFYYSRHAWRSDTSKSPKTLPPISPTCSNRCIAEWTDAALRFLRGDSIARLIARMTDDIVAENTQTVYYVRHGIGW